MASTPSAPADTPVTRIKICGLTTLADAQAVVAAGADALGLMFYERSARAVAVEVAAEISAAVAGKICRVGVFVDAPKSQVQQVLDQVELDLLQFHGQETPDYCASFDVPYCKVLAATADFDAVLQEARFATASLLMLDSVEQGQFGGTGSSIDLQHWPATPGKRWVLAGGLDASNVQGAIEQIKPYAVDVSTGVEVLINGQRCKGKKDPEQMQGFVAAVRAANLS